MATLRRLIRPLKKPVLRPYKDPWASVPNLKPFPLKWLHDIERLCRTYGCDFEFKPHTWTDGGCFNYREGKPIIQLYVGGRDSEPTPPTTYDICTVLTHELGHAIQAILYGDPETGVTGYGKLLSAHVAYEQEACRLGYYIYKEYFTDLYPSIPYHEFKTYHNKRAIMLLLAAWTCFGKMVDDLGVSST